MQRGNHRKTLGAVGLILLIVTAGGISAETVSSIMAAQAAYSHIQSTSEERSAFPQLDGKTVTVSEVLELRDPGFQGLLGYVVELEPAGFIVLSGNMAIAPIIVYSYHGNFPWEEHPENILLYMVRTDLVLRNEALSLPKVNRADANRTEWREYLEGNVRMLTTQYWPPKGSTSTGGWVETTWEQEAPYNNYCPKDPENGKRSLVGCVGTAMAQIINYNSDRRDYFHMVSFSDGDSYESKRTSPSIFIDQDASTLDFPDFETLTGYMHELRNRYISNLAPRGNDIAALSFACGIPVKMNYSGSASGTFVLWVGTAMKAKFAYTSADYVKSSEEEFYPTLEQNMKDSLPAILGLKDEAGTAGHAVVCDGLQIKDNGDRVYHLNFGWGGDNPDFILYAWYYLPQGIPMGMKVIEGGCMNIVPPQASYQPDNWISFSADGGFLGDDVYNSSGEDQSLTSGAGSGTTTTCFVKVQNDGNLPDIITVNANETGSTGWSVEYYDHDESAKITSAITSLSGWSTPELEPDWEKLLRVEVTSPEDSKQTFNVEVKSVSKSNPDSEDVVAMVSTPAVMDDVYAGQPHAITVHAGNLLADKVLITYGLPYSMIVKLAVYDIGGRLVKSLAREKMTSGIHHLVWDARDAAGHKVAAGSYFLVLETAGQTLKAKAVLIR